MSDGDFWRDKALDLVEHASLEREAWVAKAKTVAEKLAKRNGTVTSEDVRTAHPIPYGIDPRILGAVFRGNQWERAGFQKTPRACAHSRPIAVWRLKEMSHNP